MVRFTSTAEVPAGAPVATSVRPPAVGLDRDAACRSVLQ